ncbi:MAG: hypothetical protein RQ737_05120 [Bacteroidales bacterium]|nr:hypothetical protein [Bacteroidales bacterium]
MPTNEIIAHLLLLLCLNLCSCRSTTNKTTHSAVVRNVNPVGYDLSNPDRTIILPPVLLEISGITVIDSTSVACVQDENGIVFIFDLEKNELRDHFIFHYPGDYEGIAGVAGSFYVLRSDGTLFETRPDQSSDFTRQISSVGGPHADYEGLCYDKRNHRLLVVGKNNPKRDSRDEEKHPVFGIDLRSDTPAGETVLEFDLHTITIYAEENNVKVPDDDGEISLRVSGIAIHPLTNMLFVISAANRMMYVFNEDGTVHYIEKLDPDMFIMPEGISFHENGDMLISNEGKTEAPTILLFKYDKR